VNPKELEEGLVALAELDEHIQRDKRVRALTTPPGYAPGSFEAKAEVLARFARSVVLADSSGFSPEPEELFRIARNVVVVARSFAKRARELAAERRARK
jgi:hypothetical protein